jgi:hypothetical protein
MGQHHIESKAIRWIIAIIGSLASGALLVASSSMNFAYGCSMATTPVNCAIYGTAAASADVLMALCPFFFFAAKANRQYSQAFFTLCLWVITTAFATQSAIGHAALNRLDVVGHREGAVTQYKDLHTDLNQARKELGWNPDGRAEGIVLADVERHKQNQLWVRSSECVNATLKDSREYCQQYQTLQAELASARARTKLKTKIEELQSKIRAVEAKDGTAATTSEADPQAKTLSRLSGITLEQAQSASIAIGALMILFGAAYGFYASVSVLQPAPPPKPRKQKGLPPPIAGQAPQELLAITGPPEPPPIKLRAEPSPEWQDILGKIGFPLRKPKGHEPLRSKDDRSVLAWRFYTWLVAYDEARDHSAEELDQLYLEYCAADHRQPWGVGQKGLSTRIVKAELRDLGKRYVESKLPRTGDEGQERLTRWIIYPTAPAKLLAALEKNGVIKPSAQSEPPPAASPEAKTSTVTALFPAFGSARRSLPN